MPLLWPTTLVRPLAIGGAGRLTARVADPAGGTVLSVVAKVGPFSATAWDDPAALTVELHPQGGGRWGGSFFGAAPEKASVAWFAETANGWEAGPVLREVALAPAFDVHFPWLKGWLVDRLREVAASLPPFPAGRTFPITYAFPRTVQGLPALNVQIDAITPSAVFEGDLLGADALAGGTFARGRLYSLNASLVGWSATPEDRDRLSAWLLKAMEVILDAARFSEFLEPACSFEESEDFSTLEVPLFLTTARFSASVVAELRTPVISECGHLTA